MTSFFSKNKRRSTFLVLAVTFLLSFCLCFITACDDEDDTPSTSTPSKTDNCAIANGNFEFYTDDDNLKLIVSPSSWTKSNGQDDLGNSAISSSLTSGIVNTDADKWKDLTESKKAFTIEEGANVNTVMSNAAKQWDEMSTYDRLHFYEDLQDAIDEHNDKNDDTLALSDFEKYEDYTYEIDAEDIPDTANPGTHGGSEDEKSVLMIHNYHSEGYGTAQRYTSSTTVTLEANTSAKLSVWVKTQDLKYDKDGTTVDGERGANISLTHTVGGKTLEQMQIKNIDTKDVTTNNGWQQYTIYVKACSYASSTFTIVLGLGQGSQKNSMEYVEGYAFFDDVEMEIISNEDCDDAVSALANKGVCTLTSEAADKKFDVSDANAYKGVTNYVLDLYQTLTPFADPNEGFQIDVEGYLTYTMINDTRYTTENFPGVEIASNANDIYCKEGPTTLSALRNVSGNKYLDRILADDFDSAKYPFDENDDMLFLLSARGAAYTAKMESPSFELDEEEYMLISFWVKTSDTSGYTGATVTLYDEATPTALGPYNTTTMATVDLDDKEDIYDGWVQCFFFIENTSFEPRSFRMEFSYGPTSIKDTTKASYCEGYAAFTEFNYYIMNASEYEDYAGSAAQSTSVSLKGFEIQNVSGFDSVSNSNTLQIESNLANLSNYKGVFGGSKWTNTNADTSDKFLNKTNSNENEELGLEKTVGLLNKNYIGDYFENYQQNASGYAWLNTVAVAEGVNLTDALAATALWEKAFGNATQPLLIANAVEQSYGYFSTKYNLSANGYSTISVKVKVSAGAKAYIYLVDTSDQFAGYDSLHDIDTVNVTYWYDDDGNVCLTDPEGKDFAVASDTVLYRLENGLFMNNLDDKDKTLYANLANYDEDEDGNKIARTDDDGDLIISYEYSDKYVDDGVAFYYKDGKYYADAEYTVEVKDFSALTVNGKNFTKEYARYINASYLNVLGASEADLGENVTVTGTANTETYIVVDGDNPAAVGKWVTVNFFLKTGSEQFPYRLEVFSGSRDGKIKSAAGSYVAFDKCDSEDLSSTYDGLLSEAIEDMTDGNYTDSRWNGAVNLKKDEDSGRLVYASGSNEGKVYQNAEYYAYSFYDDAAFRRYDESLDENDIGNPYANYAQSDYAEELTFLYHETEIAGAPNYRMFINYSAINQTVDAEESLDTEDADEEENKWWEDPNFWLMLSSILLAVVLILVLIIMLITKMVRGMGKKGKKADNRYNAQRMQYIRKLNLTTEEEEEPAEKTEQTETSDEENPYND